MSHIETKGDFISENPKMLCGSWSPWHNWIRGGEQCWFSISSTLSFRCPQRLLAALCSQLLLGLSARVLGATIFIFLGCFLLCYFYSFHTSVVTWSIWGGRTFFCVSISINVRKKWNVAFAADGKVKLLVKAGEVISWRTGKRLRPSWWWWDLGWLRIWSHKGSGRGWVVFSHRWKNKGVGRLLNRTKLLWRGKCWNFIQILLKKMNEIFNDLTKIGINSKFSQ